MRRRDHHPFLDQPPGAGRHRARAGCRRSRRDGRGWPRSRAALRAPSSSKDRRHHRHVRQMGAAERRDGWSPPRRPGSMAIVSRRRRTQRPRAPRWTGMCGALTTSSPAASSRPQEKSRRSLMLVETRGTPQHLPHLPRDGRETVGEQLELDRFGGIDAGWRLSERIERTGGDYSRPARTARYQLPLTGSWYALIRKRLPVTGSRFTLTGSRLCVTGSHLAVTGNQLPVNGSQLPMIGGQLPVTGTRLPIIRGQLPVNGSQLPMIGERPRSQATSSRLPPANSRRPETRSGSVKTGRA